MKSNAFVIAVLLILAIACGSDTLKVMERNELPLDVDAAVSSFVGKFK